MKMTKPRREGILRVTQLTSKSQYPDVFVRDLPASEWSHKWINRDGVAIVRFEHDNTDDEADSFEFIEFSAPVQVEFIAEH